MTRQVSSFDVRGLFGYLDHSISIPRDWPFVIIYGPNGVGKTTVLRLIEAAVAGRFGDVIETPFDSLSIGFSDNARLRIDRFVEQSTGELVRGTVLLTTALGERFSEEIERRAEISPALRTWLTSETSWRPIDRGLWRDYSDGEILTDRDLIEMYSGRYVQGEQRATPERQANRGRIAEFLGNASPIMLSTDRLASRERQSRAGRYRLTQTISTYSDEIRAMVRGAFTQDAVLSQELDRTFPVRLLADDLEHRRSEIEIRRAYEAQNRRRGELRRLGLISGVAEISLPEGAIDPWKVRALDLFLRDAEQRLRKFDELLPKFSLFHQMMNTRLIGKRLQISDDGFDILVERTGETIAPTLLSSGEQHELVLTYSLIFHSGPDRIVLIDEPEISLHVAWQRQFLPDLNEIMKLTGARALIATHSPMIVDRWSEYLVELDHL